MLAATTVSELASNPSGNTIVSLGAMGRLAVVNIMSERASAHVSAGQNEASLQLGGQDAVPVLLAAKKQEQPPAP